MATKTARKPTAAKSAKKTTPKTKSSAKSMKASASKTRTTAKAKKAVAKKTSAPKKAATARSNKMMEPMNDARMAADTTDTSGSLTTQAKMKLSRRNPKTFREEQRLQSTPDSVNPATRR